MAYKALLDSSTHREKVAVNHNNSSKKTAWSSGDSSGKRAESKQNSSYSNETTWTPEDWATYFKPDYKRIPFEWKRLHVIFFRSLMEMSSFKSFYLGLMAFLLAIMSFTGPYGRVCPYGDLLRWFYTVSWFFYIVFRYYIDISEWELSTQIIVVIFYGAILIFLITCFYTVPREYVIVTGLLAMAASVILIFDFDES